MSENPIVVVDARDQPHKALVDNPAIVIPYWRVPDGGEIIEGRREWRREKKPIRHGRMLSLEIGESVLYSWDELSFLSTGAGAVRSSSSYWGLKRGRRFETNKTHEGVWVKRLA